jgi:repressor LexA
MAEQLTTRQRRILEVIRDAVADRGYPPSIREIGEAVGLTSTSSVHSQLEALQRKGFIRRDPTKPRAIEVHLEEPVAAMPRPLPTYVPLMSAPVAAGTGTLPEDVVEELLPLPRELVGQGQLFMLQVRGESMVGAGVLDRDYVVVRRQESADNGDMVAALPPTTSPRPRSSTSPAAAAMSSCSLTIPPSSPSTGTAPRSSGRSSRFCAGSGSRSPRSRLGKVADLSIRRRSG